MFSRGSPPRIPVSPPTLHAPEQDCGPARRYDRELRGLIQDGRALATTDPVVMEVLAGASSPERTDELLRRSLTPHSPVTTTCTVRSRDRVSKSMRTTCCQVPNGTRPSTTGSASDGPTRAARTWEWPLSSCQVSSCS